VLGGRGDLDRRRREQRRAEKSPLMSAWREANGVSVAAPSLPR
jgi:hypothetical protein